MPLALLCDEHIPYSVVHGLRAQGIDAIPVQRIGSRTAGGLLVLDVAQREGRVIYTRDADFLRWQHAGPQYARILYHYVRKYSVGQAIEVMAVACQTLSADDIRNQVQFL